LAIAQSTKDAEVADMVSSLEGLSAEVCNVREHRTLLMTQCKEVSREHEQLVVQINAVKEQVREQDQTIMNRKKEVRDLEVQIAQINHEIAAATVTLNQAKTQCERRENERQGQRQELSNLEGALDQMKADCKAWMGKLRDEEQL